MGKTTASEDVGLAARKAAILRVYKMMRNFSESIAEHHLDDTDAEMETLYERLGDLNEAACAAELVCKGTEGDWHGPAKQSDPMAEYRVGDTYVIPVCTKPCGFRVPDNFDVAKVRIVGPHNEGE